MQPTSQAQQRIINAAIEIFAISGYEASPLQQIAAKVGIKKASIYAHFDKKDSLFRHCYAAAAQREIAYIQALPTPDSLVLPGFDYTAQLKTRYSSQSSLKFLLKTAFFHPQHLKDSINQGYASYLEQLNARFCSALAAFDPEAHCSANALSQAYLGMIDSLHVELIYANAAAFDRRLAGFDYLFSAILLPSAT